MISACSYKLKFTAALAAAMALLAAPAQAVIQFDQNITPDVIFGSGNANGAWTTDRANGVELGLRAKVRFNALNLPENTFNSNGDGTYSFVAGLPPTGFGFAPGSTSTATWNFEWSINSNFDNSSGLNLNQLTYLLEIDFDPGAGTNFLSFDPINQPCADHAIGTNATPNGGGTTVACPAGAAAYVANIAANNVGQNSWNMEFFDNAGAGFPFNGGIGGIYDIRLSAFSASAGTVASTQIQVLVPEPTTLAMSLSGLLGLGLLGWRRRRSERAAAAAA